MQANQAFAIRTMARVLGVSSSGYHDWLDRQPSGREQANEVLLAQIRAIHAISDHNYGVPRMAARIAREGVIVNKKRVERLMRAAGLKGISRRRGWCVTTQRDRDATDCTARWAISHHEFEQFNQAKSGQSPVATTAQPALKSSALSRP